MGTKSEKKIDENKTHVVTLLVYVMIMSAVIYLYQDLLITITAFVILGVLLFQYIVPLIREKKNTAAKADKS